MSAVAGGPSGPSERLAEARRRIDRLDRELIRIAAERLHAAEEAGCAKAAMGQTLIDFQREREVLEAVRATATEADLEPQLAEDLVTRLILASTTTQEHARIASLRPGHGRQAVVVGGAGRMGRWLTAFLQTSGYATHVLDPATPGGNLGAAGALVSADLVLLAVPPSIAADLYREWSASPPRGIVADVCSVKSPLLDPLRAFVRSGGRAASFHPMFGPSTSMLRGADVVLCITGDAAAEQAIRDLFASTSARLVEISLEDHDRVMAEVLTLAHATAIAFAASLEGRPATQSTTFRRLRDVAASVVDESPQVYYEIQAGNPHSAAALGRLAGSLDRLRAAVVARDADGFRALLDEGRAHLKGGS